MPEDLPNESVDEHSLKPDVMTPDGRREVAIKLLEDWRSAANFNRYDYADKTLEQRHRAGKLLEEILELMGVDS